MPSRWAKTGTRASACTRPTSPLPPRGTITSMNSVIVSIAPTAARSVVGTSWIAASGSPAAFSPGDEAGVDRLRRAQALRAAAQDRRVPGLQAERAGVGGDVRPALEDHPDHPERRPHPPDVQARRPVPFGDHLPDRDRAARRWRAAPRPSPRPAPRRASAGRASPATGRGPRRRPCRRRWPRAARRDPPRSRRPRRAAPRPSARTARRRARARRPAPPGRSPASARRTSTRSSIALSLRSPGRRGAPAPPGPRGRAARRSGRTGAP